MSFARVSGFGDDTGNFGIRVAKTGSPTVTPRPTRPPNLSPPGMIPTGNRPPKTSKSGPRETLSDTANTADDSVQSGVEGEEPALDGYHTQTKWGLSTLCRGCNSLLDDHELNRAQQQDTYREDTGKQPYRFAGT